MKKLSPQTKQKMQIRNKRQISRAIRNTQNNKNMKRRNSYAIRKTNNKQNNTKTTKADPARKSNKWKKKDLPEIPI